MQTSQAPLFYQCSFMMWWVTFFFALEVCSVYIFSLKKKRRQQRAEIELKEGTQVAAGWLSSFAGACMNNKLAARRTRPTCPVALSYLNKHTQKISTPSGPRWTRTTRRFRTQQQLVAAFVPNFPENLFFERRRRRQINLLFPTCDALI